MRLLNRKSAEDAKVEKNAKTRRSWRLGGRIVLNARRSRSTCG
ncbi:hypothetical protein ACP3TJ_03725 [Desulforudis sp. 1088]